MQKFRIIFIDDSGDPGLKTVSSRFLVFAAVVFDAPEQKHNLYGWGISELLKIVKANNAIIRIDGKTNKKQTRTTKTYLRKELSKNRIYAKDIRFDDSVNSLAIQLADLVVGSARRYLEASKTDSGVYYETIRSHIDQIKEL